MTQPKFTITCVATDRSRPIASGEFAVPGCDVTVNFAEPEAIFREALNEQSFEICELSMASHIVTTANDSASYIAVPVFLSRAFRHSAIFVRSGAGIETLADLKGRAVGLPEYQQTAALWVRGMMRDAGVAASDVDWHVGGLNQPSAGERIALSLPPGIRTTPLSGDQTLDAMLLAGELDAIISPRVPESLSQGHPGIARLYPDLRTAEIDYYQRTGFFPIMHCLAVRKDVAERHSWLPEALFTTFSRAKQARIAEMGLTNVLRVSHPWGVHDHRDTMRLTNDDPWPYGFARNREELEAMTAYAEADGTAVRKVDPKELFHPSTFDLSE